MATKAQMTGMLGRYLAAAELTNKDWTMNHHGGGSEAPGFGEDGAGDHVRWRGPRNRRDRGFLALFSGMRLLKLFVAATVSALAFSPSLA
jgi:hypothetical protein